MIIRATIANLDPTRAASLGQASGLAGTVFSGLGFGSWGTEPGTTFELATADPGPVRDFILATLRGLGESAAYVTVDGRSPALWWADGRIESLDGKASDRSAA